MASENKKLALLRILEILQENTDCDHMLTHSEIAEKLLSEYGIEIERKAVGRNISLLLEADYDIVTTKRGVGDTLAHRRSTFKQARKPSSFARFNRKARKRGKQVFSQEYQAYLFRKRL